MKDNIMKFINELEGYKTAIKNQHWSSKNMNEHKLFDDIASSVSDIQDMVAEISQGIYGKIEKNELNPTDYTIDTPTKFLEDLHKSTNDFYSTIKKGDEYIGLRSEIEGFIGEVEQFKYLMTLALNESTKHKMIIVTESAKNRLFNESVLMDKERGKNARAFRKALSNALTTNSYEYVPEENKIYIDGFSYEIGKKYAETNDGEPIPLHYTFNSVNKYIMDKIDLSDNEMENNFNDDEMSSLYENKNEKMGKIKLTEEQLRDLIRKGVMESLKEIGDKATNPHDLWGAAEGMRKKGYHDNAAKLDAKAKELYHKNGNDTFVGDAVNTFHNTMGGNDWLRKFDHHPEKTMNENNVQEIGDTPKGQFMLGRLGARNMSNYAQQKGDKRGTAYLGGEEYDKSMNGVGGYANKQRNKPDYAQPSKAFNDGFGTERENEWDVANNTTPSYGKKDIDWKYDFWKNSQNMR